MQPEIGCIPWNLCTPHSRAGSNTSQKPRRRRFIKETWNKTNNTHHSTQHWSGTSLSCKRKWLSTLWPVTAFSHLSSKHTQKASLSTLHTSPYSDSFIAASGSASLSPWQVMWGKGTVLSRGDRVRGRHLMISPHVWGFQNTENLEGLGHGAAL